MCGFVGFYDKRETEEKKKIVGKMMERIVHRGPDMGGIYTDEAIALGFRRLSIIDLSEKAAQPMFNEDKTLVAVFNGEIYNFPALREDLEQKGHIFASNSDTEVLLHGYEEYGKQFVERLRGMFGFVLWDIQKQMMVAARDPFGIKPFYYAKTAQGGLVFGSEIKSFLEYPDFKKAVNPTVLRSYLTLQYCAGEETFFEGVYSLPQGHMLTWDGKTLCKECYFTVQFEADEKISFDDCVAKIDTAVHESVEAHRISDVTVGCFLSGGVDSSYITACLQPEKTFSVGFAQHSFDETSYAKELSEKLGIQNFSKQLTAEECFAAFSDIQYHMDQPQANPSSVPLWFLAKLAREHVTVVLSGEGADEMFAGYELYADTPAMEKFKKTPLGLRRMLGGFAKSLPDGVKGKNFLLKSAERPETWFVGQAMVFPEKEAVSVLRPAYQKGPAATELAAPFYAKVQDKDEVTKKQFLDMNMWLPGDILLKADKMCMAHSLELRVPLLDKKIMALAESVPTRYRIQGAQNKVVFRRAANTTLPDEWANRPKKGFPVPIRYWLQEEKYYKMVREDFTSEWAAAFFDTEKITRLLDDHYQNKKNNGRKIWVVYTFLVWYKRFFIEENQN